MPASRFKQDEKPSNTDPDIDIVVAVIGGIEPARSIITEALKAVKRPVVHSQQRAAGDV